MNKKFNCSSENTHLLTGQRQSLSFLASGDAMASIDGRLDPSLSLLPLLPR